MAEIRARGIRLPIGLFRNDHVITRMLWSERDVTNLSPERIQFSESAGVYRDRVSVRRASSTIRCWRQQRRFRWRNFQLHHLHGVPLTDLPETMDYINLQILKSLRNGSGIVVSPEMATARSQSQHSVYDHWLARYLQRLYPDGEGAFFAEQLKDSRWSRV